MTLIEEMNRVSPALIVGALITAVAIGALLAETLFVVIASVVAINVYTGAILWMALGLLVMALGYIRSLTYAQ